MIVPAIFALIAAVAEVQAAPAAAPAPAQRAASSVPISSLDSLIGRWSGAGTFARSGSSVGSATEFQKIANSDAVSIVHREKAPNTFAYNALVSFDSISG